MAEGFRSLLPAPARVVPASGAFRAGGGTAVRAAPDPPELAATAALLADTVGARFAGTGGAAPGCVWLGRGGDAAALGPEGYRLEVRADGVQLVAPTAAGVFHGTQTLRQLWPDLPCGVVEDRPAFAWRGLLLDCCRHFLDIDYVLATVDRLAFHKMNRLHWHLTEDQGWRLPVAAYPRLAEVAAWRTAPDGTRHGGCYTRDEVRRVVEYAAARHVTVVPEVEMPGHAVAALAAYPELSCTGGPFTVETRWGIFDAGYCAGTDRVFAFLETVLGEALDLFPGPWIHVGGDECPRTRWRDCPRCQARIRAEGLRDEDHLQSWFIARINAFLRGAGRTLVGWDEILEGGLAPGAVVQSWRGTDGAVAAARAGHDTIVSPTSHVYLDYGLDRIDLRQAFAFDPVPAALTPAEARHVLGGECNLWTERAPQELVDCKLYPRFLAVAERLWSGTGGDWEPFHARVQAHYPRLDRLGVEYGAEFAEPGCPEGDP